MKKNCLLLVLLSFSITSLFSQWTFKKGETDFDGSYKTSSVFGYGGSFPYQKPLFVINKFDDGTPNIYITGAGYSGCDGKQILFKFKGDDSVYKTTSVSEGRENESWFIDSFENLEIIEFFNLLKKNSLMSVRLLSDCSKKDYKFSLKGSTKALNFVIGEDYFENYKKKKQKELIRLKNESLEVEKTAIFLIDSLKQVNALESTLKRYSYLIDKFSDNKFEIKEINSLATKLYRGMPLKISSNVKNYNKGIIIVIDSSFDDGDFRRVEYIEGVGMDPHYVLKNVELKKVNKDLLKKVISMVKVD